MYTYIYIYICDPSARSPNRFFIEMRLGMKWLVATNDMKDAGGRNPLAAQPVSITNLGAKHLSTDCAEVDEVGYEMASCHTRHEYLLANMLRMTG